VSSHTVLAWSCGTQIHRSESAAGAGMEGAEWAVWPPTKLDGTGVETSGACQALTYLGHRNLGSLVP